VQLLSYHTDDPDLILPDEVLWYKGCASTSGDGAQASVDPND